MSTDDWKSELKQRIRDIREKKEQERKAKERNDSFRTEARKQAEKAKEKAEKAPEERRPRKSEPKSGPDKQPSTDNKTVVRQEPARQERATNTSAPQPEVRQAQDRSFAEEDLPERSEAGDEADDLFRVSEEAEKPQTGSRNQQKRSEARIREELARVSGPAKQKEHEDTLFPLESGENQNEEQTGKPAKKAYGDLSEKRSRFTARDVDIDAEKPPQPEDPSVDERDSAGSRQENDEDLEDAMVHPSDSLDDAMDEYIPADELEEMPREAAAMAPDSMPRKPTVIDKTARYTATMRLGAAAIDIGIVAAIELSIIWIAGMIVQTSPLDIFLNSLIPMAGLFLALHFIYYLPFTAVTGQTPGKALMNLRAVRKDGLTVGVPFAAARWVLATVGTLCLVGYFMMFFTPAGKGLQDLALGMRVRRETARSE